MMLAITLLSLNKVMAQTTDAPPTLQIKETSFHNMEFGLLIMPTFASFNMNTYYGETVEGEATHAYGYGISLKKNCSNYVGVEADAIYNSYSKTYQDGYLKREVNIHYINVPLLFCLSTNKSIPVSFNVVIGPQVGFNAGSNIKTTPNEAKDTLQGTLTLKQTDFDLVYGCGLDFAFNRKQTMHLGIGFRGAYGLTDMGVSNKTNNTGNYDIIYDGNLKTYSGYVRFTFAF